MITTLVLALCAVVQEPAAQQAQSAQQTLPAQPTLSAQQTLPAAERFFLGGYSSLRGFAFRGAGQSDAPSESVAGTDARFALHSTVQDGSNAAALPSATGNLEIKWESPKTLLEGGSLEVHVEITGPKDGADVPLWMLETAGFAVDGKPLGERGSGPPMKLGPNGRISIELDLGPAIASLKGMEHKSFKLSYGEENNGTQPIEVSYMQVADKGLDFLKMSAEDLAKYHVVLQTNRGDMECEFWPDMAPKTVANFLDLCYTGFYNGSPFHRVIPNFMIQGGRPGSSGVNAPRTLKAEFNAKKHDPGVLSMARTSDPDSATSEFFIVHGKSPHLDGQYTAFGKLVNGFEVVDKIAKTKCAGEKPMEPQTILKTVVVRMPGK